MIGFLDSLKHPYPHIVESTPPPVVGGPGAGMNAPEYRVEPYFIVASIEMGNTTTKCVLTGTNMETGLTYIINKTVTMTRDIRMPRDGEEIFAASLVGHSVSREGVQEHIKNVLLRCHKEADLDIKNDLDYVVHSTGLVAAWNSPGEVGDFMAALAQGCIDAGVPPKKLTPPFSKEHLPEKLRKYSLLDHVTFSGMVASVTPPTGLAGDQIIANEMEGELAVAGIKEGAMQSHIDFRNPCIGIDFGTTVDGRITGDVLHDAEDPFAKTIGSICGLGGAIPDALAQGTGVIDGKKGSALDLFGDKHVIARFTHNENNIIKNYDDEIHSLISVGVLPDGCTHVGMVPVDPKVAGEAGVKIIGVDCGDNFSEFPRLNKIGGEIYENHGMATLQEVVDRVCARLALRIIDVAVREDLFLKNTAIGFTGRAAMSGRKPEYIYYGIREMGLYENPYDHVVFVDDGLARGASLMARCMSGLGRPKTPVGGVRGGPCILARRKKIGK
jgi:putative methanogenesis marker protein 14